MMNFDAFVEALRTELTQTAREFGEEYVQDVVTSGTNFALALRENLIRRKQQLVSGDLTPDEFEWLLKSDRDLIELHALKQKGLAVAQLNRIQDAVIGSVVRVLAGLT